MFQARKRLLQQMEQADSYQEWTLAATKLVQMDMEGLTAEEKRAKIKREGRLYARELVESRLSHLRRVRREGKVHEMVFAVRMDLIRNLGNMANRWGALLGVQGTAWNSSRLLQKLRRCTSHHLVLAETMKNSSLRTSDVLTCCHCACYLSRMSDMPVLLHFLRMTNTSSRFAP